MISLLRRHCFLAATAILLWQGWAASAASSATPEPAAGETAPLPPPVLTADDLARRADGTAPLAPADPFFLRELLMRHAADAQSAAPGSSAQSSANQPAQHSLTAGVRLTLQSTMPSGARGRAWINGHDLAVGDAIPGVSAASPPVLKAVSGSRVTISWAGRDYLLDLYSAAAIELPLIEEDAQ